MTFEVVTVIIVAVVFAIFGFVAYKAEQSVASKMAAQRHSSTQK